MRAAASRLSQRLALSATTVSSLSMFLMALDFALLRTGGDPWAPPITAAQSGLLLLSLGHARRRGRALELRERGSRHLAYYLIIGGVGLLALAQKWWIAVAIEPAARLPYAETYRVMGATITSCTIAAALGREQRFTRFFAAFAEHPARQMALSFLALAVFGGFLLTLPASVRDPSQVSFLDSLFMATSAVCVTGLALHSVPMTYAPFGQAVLLLLIQAGGLGIMVLSASMTVLTGRKLRARSSAALAEVLDTESIASLRGTILRIVSFTFAIEAVGAVALYFVLAGYPQVALEADVLHPMAGSGSVLWAAVFHSISAFCNAGFSLIHGGLAPFADSYALCGVIMALITLGGLGFPVLSELSLWIGAHARKRRPAKLTLHTRVVLWLSLVLTLGVALLLALVEWDDSLAVLPWSKRPLAALFQSVTMRTAGFNTVNIASFSHAGLMIACMFMFVGASPGSTGGGVKVTTFAVLFATFRAELRGAGEAVLFDRRLPDGTVRRAIAVAFVAVVVLTFVSLLLLLSEEAPPLALVFEAVSAFGTVGLSADVTPTLGSFGKTTILLTMLIGRVGPLTIAIAASQRRARAHHHQPLERVLIG